MMSPCLSSMSTSYFLNMRPTYIHHNHDIYIYVCMYNIYTRDRHDVSRVSQQLQRLLHDVVTSASQRLRRVRFL